jgi:hypothetical protein
MADAIEGSILTGKKALAVFLDIKGAFDNLSSTTIANGMRNHNVNEDIIGWLKNYLDSRYCSVKGSRQFFKLILGRGQGGILSPMLWNFVMDSFLDIFTDAVADVIGYADDGALVIRAEDIGFAQRQMQMALNEAQQWTSEVGLTFSIAKTKAVIYPGIKIPLPYRHRFS